jgi:hypothetical protein
MLLANSRRQYKLLTYKFRWKALSCRLAASSYLKPIETVGKRVSRTCATQVLVANLERKMFYGITKRRPWDTGPMLDEKSN